MRVTRLSAGLFALLTVGTAIAVLLSQHAAAAETPGNFSLLITPSPIVTTLKPGTATDIELKIRNGGTSTEELRIDSRSFKFNSQTGQVALNDTEPTALAGWITYANPTFSVQAGQWFTQKIHIALPKDTGFSYSFALVISRKNNPAPTPGARQLKGSVADFMLINVDRPGATRKLEIPKFKATHGLYEYLPAEFNIQFKNSGNSIVQPAGTIFVQRGSDDKTPIATLPVNEKKGYILPDTSRDISAAWADGFPHYKSTTASDGSTKQNLIWDWGKAKFSNIRFGRYTAKLVAIYDDGTRDVAIQQEITFWVVPWRAILLILMAITGLYLLARWRGKRRTAKAVKKALAAADKAKKASETKAV